MRTVRGRALPALFLTSAGALNASADHPGDVVAAIARHNVVAHREPGQLMRSDYARITEIVRGNYVRKWEN
jgi:hypothetical protein